MGRRQIRVRLIQKNTKTFIGISFILMFVSTIVLYFYMRNLLQAEVEEELRSTSARIESALFKNKQVFGLSPIVEIEDVSLIRAEKLKDTIIFDPSQNEMEEFRELATFKNINGKPYKITVRALIVESENILIAVVLSYLVIIIVVFIFLFYFNKSHNSKLWRPFFENLEQMKRFSLTADRQIQLIDSDILEFSELNNEITTLTNKVRSDYKNLRQYTEDVSHEMQTPLAVIQAKIENIINGEHLNNDQYEQFTSIQKDIYRLTQMNKRLTLLTKIENQQFINPETFNLNHLVEERIKFFSELFPIEIEFLSEQDIEVTMDPYLADVLCDNLLSNAIKYNIENECIKVVLSNNTLIVSNKGADTLIRPELLFTRFYRETNKEKSTGLGLAIVQKICDLYHFEPTYVYENHRHVLKVQF